MNDSERACENQQELLGLPDGNILRNKFSDDDLNRRDEKKRDDGRRHMEDRARDGSWEKAGSTGGESVLTQPTDAQASRSDGDLRYCEILAHMIDDEDCVLAASTP